MITGYSRSAATGNMTRQPPRPPISSMRLIGIINFIERDRQWFQARHGITVAEPPVEQAVCVHCLEEGELLVIRDPPATGARRTCHWSPKTLRHAFMRVFQLSWTDRGSGFWP